MQFFKWKQRQYEDIWVSDPLVEEGGCALLPLVVSLL